MGIGEANILSMELRIASETVASILASALTASTHLSFDDSIGDNEERFQTQVKCC